MKGTVVLINDSKCQQWIASDLADAKYILQRRIEKDGFEAELGFFFKYGDTSASILPVKEWVDDYYKNIVKIEREQSENREKQEYERLKRKYEK